jgi:hypothetical protein
VTANLDTIARIDSGDRSLRLERSRFVSVNGPRTVLQIATYRRTRGGQWVRERAVSVRRSELRQLAERLAELAHEGAA